VAADALNPFLAQTRFCPRCGAPGPDKDGDRSLTRAACGFVAYFNPKPVACAIPRDPATGAITLLRRGFDPGKGRWTFPGGFVDLGESVEEARAARGPRGARARGGARPADRRLLAAHRPRRARRPHARPQPGARARTTSEAAEVRAFAPADLPWDELAFWSTERALRDALGAPRTSR